MEEEIKKLTQKIDTLISIIAIQGKEQDEQVRILRTLDYSIIEIANLLGVNSRTIDRKIAELKKNKKL